jgi:hypothetical protein
VAYVIHLCNLSRDSSFKGKGRAAKYYEFTRQCEQLTPLTYHTVLPSSQYYLPLFFTFLSCPTFHYSTNAPFTIYHLPVCLTFRSLTIPCPTFYSSKSSTLFYLPFVSIHLLSYLPFVSVFHPALPSILLGSLPSVLLYLPIFSTFPLSELTLFSSFRSSLFSVLPYRLFICICRLAIHFFISPFYHAQRFHSFPFVSIRFHSSLPFILPYLSIVSNFRLALLSKNLSLSAVLPLLPVVSSFHPTLPSINPKPHGSGPICPHFFQRPITQKVLKCKKSATNTYSTENVC